jgi:hypothetical protein
MGRLLQRQGRATRILNWWVSSSNSKSGQNEVQDWAVEFVAQVVKKEAEVITREGILHRQTFDEQSVIGFGFGELYQSLQTIPNSICAGAQHNCPINMADLERNICSLGDAEACGMLA